MTGQAKKLEWHTEQIRINDLIPFEGNPRQITKKQVHDLKKSLEKFNIVDIPAMDIDRKVIGGHQRQKILQLLGRGDEMTDVRVPNRKLTDEEFLELNLRLNKNVAEWDFDMLANFDEAMLKEVGWTDEEMGFMFQTDMKGPGKKKEQEDKKATVCPECGYEFNNINKLAQ